MYVSFKLSDGERFYYSGRKKGNAVWSLDLLDAKVFPSRLKAAGAVSGVPDTYTAVLIESNEQSTHP